MVVFLLNGFVFISIGLQLPTILHDLRGESLGHLVDEAALISGAVIGVRIIWVFVAMYVPRLLYKCADAASALAGSGHYRLGRDARSRLAGGRFRSPFHHLEMPAPFPRATIILFFTFAVILATLVLQGLTLPLLIRAARHQRRWRDRRRRTVRASGGKHGRDRIHQ